MGVEVDTYRRPVALHLFEAHPNDGTRTSRRRVRVEAGEVLHRFRVERAEQVRGIPWMAPGMLSLHHLGGFMLSALLAAEHGANHYGFFQQGEDGMAGPPIGTPENQGAETVNIATSQPGTYDTLPTGYTFQPHESKYPNEVFGPFVKTILQRVATGWRVAYHSLANDLEGVSFSSIRSGTLEERDRWTADQEWFITAFMEPVFQAWLQMALLSGAVTMPNGSALPASKLAKFSKHEWQARRWEWVDPKSDMEAKILSVRAGLMAPQDLSAAMGYDFEDTLKAIKQAQDLAKLYGVSLTAYESTPGAVPAGGAPAGKTAA
jgi:lambda family phage portal protein